MDLLHYAGIIQAILLGLFFFHKRDIRGNLTEALLLWSLAVTIWIGHLYSTREILHFPHIARTGFSFLALPGPLYYFSVRLREEQPILFREYMWFLVPVGITLYLIPFHLSPVEHKLNYLREDLVQIHTDCLIILYITLFNNLTSMVLSLFRVYRKNREWIRESRNRPLITGHAIYYLLPIFILVSVGVVVALDSRLLNSGYFSAASAVVILVRSYSQFYETGNTTAPDFSESYPPAIQYRNSRISEAEVMRLGKKIEAFLEEEKPYLEPDFQLADLLSVTQISQVQTSQVINRYFQESFTDLSRRLRVKEACELLRTRPDSFTILDIAMESGFNSKSTFNMVFRKITGSLPSDYRKEIRAQKAAG